MTTECYDRLDDLISCTTANDYQVLEGIMLFMSELYLNMGIVTLDSTGQHVQSISRIEFLKDTLKRAILAIENNCYSSAVKRRYDRSRLCKCINSLIVNYLPSHGATIGSILRSNNSSHSNFDNYIGISKQIDLAMRTATKWPSLINCRATSFRFSNLSFWPCPTKLTSRKRYCVFT